MAEPEDGPWAEPDPTDSAESAYWLTIGSALVGPSNSLIMYKREPWAAYVTLAIGIVITVSAANIPVRARLRKRRRHGRTTV